jgi:NAD(P)H-hydrate epimerase
VVVLKGARTVVCDGISNDGLVTVNPTGNPGLATAGSGDVLTGVIAALIAQGTPPADAARLGVYLHGRAGDLATAALGSRSVTASDVIDELSEALVEMDG